MNLDHVQELYNFIKTVPPASCNMTYFMELANNPIDGKPNSAAWIVTHDFTCGSAGCIAGLGDIYIRWKYPDHKLAVNNVDDITARWLELDGEEENCLFTHFPGHTPEEGWKAWMLHRLSEILKTGTIGCPLGIEEE